MGNDMRRQYRTGLVSATVLASLLLAPTLGQAQSMRLVTPTSAAGTDTRVADVVVTGQGRAKTAATASSDRTLRINPTSASSCNFVAGSDTYMEDFIATMGVRRTKGKSLVDGQTVTSTTGTLTTTPTDGGEAVEGSAGAGADAEAAMAAANGAYFSETAPFGDASGGSNVDFTSNLTSEGPGNPCGAGDRLAIASRATIARNDRTLPDGYRLYDEGKLVEAIESFKKGYAKLPDGDGGLEAAYMIGKAGLELPAAQRDAPEAISWLKKAAGGRFDMNRDMPAFDPDNPYSNDTVLGQAASLLGQVYLTGIVVPRDVAEAAKWYERAEEVGYVPAGKLVGDIYYYGYGVQKDPARAVKYYKKAAGLGFAPAQFALANILYVGEAGEREDVRTALAWYEQAAKRGHAGAQLALAEAFDAGDGVAANPKQALAYYASAAAGGNADAQAALGTYFYEGEEVQKDLPTARKWFEAAASRQQVDAMFNLAAMLTKGEGGDKDLVRAWVWFSLAKTRGHPNAAAALASIEPQMTGEQRQQAAQILSPTKAG
jgi:TPR repeat protein